MKKLLGRIFLVTIVLIIAMTPGMAKMMNNAETVDTAPIVTIDLTDIVNAIIGVLFALITYKVIPAIKANTNEKQQAKLESIAKIGVFAAEQLYGAFRGDEKLAYVQAYLQSKGYDVNTDDVKNVIEAKVQELTLGQTKKLEHKPPETAA